MEALVGFEYNAGCWAARVVAHRFVTGVDEESTSLFFQLELKGLSRIGNNPLKLLRQNINDYTHSPTPSAPSNAYFPNMKTKQ